MKGILVVVQIVIPILLILAILLQQKGAGLSATFGGTGNFYSSKRGAEKVLHYTTVVLATLFIGLSLAFTFL